MNLEVRANWVCALLPRPRERCRLASPPQRQQPREASGEQRRESLRNRCPAKRRGFASLSGSILRVTEPMIAFVRSLGFAIEDDPEDAAQVWATLPLA